MRFSVPDQHTHTSGGLHVCQVGGPVGQLSGWEDSLQQCTGSA
jgi:hypothetical protein